MAITPRAGQVEFERGVKKHRVTGYLCRRQYGKTTTAARIAVKKMMQIPGHTVVFGSVKLDLGRDIVRKEAEAFRKAIKGLSEQAKDSATLLDLVDSQGGKSVLGANNDDFAELYEATRLEFRLWHDRTVYSRTKVVALNESSVGETGDLILDEVGRVKNFRGVWEAVAPIIASNPEFRCLLTTTPPPDDSHYSFELLAPPVGADFPVNPKGNWYRSDLGVWVLRIDAWDAAADNVPLYDDDSGAPITPEASRAAAPDKDAWDRNYGVRFVLGGAAAVGLLELDAAQRRGIGQCRLFQVANDSDFEAGLDWLSSKIGAGPVAVGVDWATTEKLTSNPTAVAVAERSSLEVAVPAVFVWKTTDPDLAIARIKSLVDRINHRPTGGRCRRLAQDATSEKYHCKNVRKALAALVPVEDVVASETVDQPGGEPITKKALLGNRLVGVIADNRATLPPERYLKNDFRSVKRDRGSFVAEIGPNGEHGDTFDAVKLALHALGSREGAISTTDGVLVPRPSVIARVYKPLRLARRVA